MDSNVETDNQLYIFSGLSRHIMQKLILYNITIYNTTT